MFFVSRLDHRQNCYEYYNRSWSMKANIWEKTIIMHKKIVLINKYFPEAGK